MDAVTLQIMNSLRQAAQGFDIYGRPISRGEQVEAIRQLQAMEKQTHEMEIERLRFSAEQQRVDAENRRVDITARQVDLEERRIEQDDERIQIQKAEVIMRLLQSAQAVGASMHDGSLQALLGAAIPTLALPGPVNTSPANNTKD